MIKYFLKADTATDKVAKAQTDRQTDGQTGRPRTHNQATRDFVPVVAVVHSTRTG